MVAHLQLPFEYLKNRKRALKLKLGIDVSLHNTFAGMQAFAERFAKDKRI